jgi:thioredoxin-dependent peroxiredoxin
MNKAFWLVSIVALATTAGCKPAAEKQAEAKAPEKVAEPAMLKVGDTAPMFKTEGALAGKPYTLDLAEQLKKGSLVLYFFPKVFTPGCTAEAHEFAEKTADFEKLGASVVGMSADDISGLTKFSSEACRDKFAVARATPEIIKSYGVQLPNNEMASRTSFVIDKQGKVAFVHSEMDYKDHVKLTYAAVERLAGKNAS